MLESWFFVCEELGLRRMRAVIRSGPAIENYSPLKSENLDGSSGPAIGLCYPSNPLEMNVKALMPFLSSDFKI